MALWLCSFYLSILFFFSLDNYDVDERINKDMCDYITLRIHESTLLKKNIIQSISRYSDDNPHTRFQKHLVGCAKGSFLYVKLIIELIDLDLDRK